MVYDIFINDQYWRSLDYPGVEHTPLGRILAVVEAAKLSGELAPFEKDGRYAVKIVPQDRWNQ